MMDPLHIQGLVNFPYLGVLFPRFLVYHQEHHVGKHLLSLKGVWEGEGGGGLLEFQLLLVQQGHVAILLLGLDMAPVA